MELRQLTYFLAVAETNSISRASAVLGIAQSALSRQIRFLEKELSTQLFYRHGRGVQLTQEGTRFQASVSPAVRELLQAKSEVMTTREVPAGAITLGMPGSISAVIGARVVEAFRRSYPQVKLHVLDGFSGHITEWLVDGRLDLAVINSARRPPHLQMDPLLTVDLYFVSPRSTAGRGRPGTISFAEAAGQPLILPGRHHGLRRVIDNAARKHDIQLDIVAEVDALEALKQLVLAKVARTILPQGAIINEMQNGHLVVRRIADPDLTMQFMIAYALQRPGTFAVRELARTIRDEVRTAVNEGRLLGHLKPAHPDSA